MNKIKGILLLLLSMFFISCNISSAWAAKNSAPQSGIMIGVKNHLTILVVITKVGVPVDLYVNNSHVGTAPYNTKKTTYFPIDPKKFGMPPYHVTLSPIAVRICPTLFQKIAYIIQDTGHVISVSGILPFQACSISK